MRKRRICAPVAATVVALALWYVPAYGMYRDFIAASFRTGANVMVEADEVISDELIAVGANVQITGDLKKGLKAFGANVTVPGTVGGAVYSAGAAIELSGTFKGKVTAAGAHMILSGTFENDVEVATARLTLTPTAIINADLTYSAAVLSRQEGSQVLGSVIKKQKALKTEKAHEWRRKGEKAAKGAGIILWFVGTIALILVGLIISSFFPKQTDCIVEMISQSPWASIGIGLVFLVVVPVAIVIACITVVGIPAAIIAGLLYVIIVYISRIYIGLWIGRKILSAIRRREISSLFWPLVWGVVIIGLIGLIPFFGWLFKLFCLLISLGALFLGVWRPRPPKCSVES